MCGIIGLFNINKLSKEKKLLSVKLGMEKMHFRGPDDEGVYEDDIVIIGQKRLAIIDPEFAIQPWVDGETGVVLAYNGEIYNFRKIRKKLELLGHNFKTDSDTEVLMKSYLQWGKDMVAKLSGIFAFAIYNPLDKSLLLVRDRLGAKPLFYSFVDDGIIFASTMSAMLQVPCIERKMELSAVSHYLTSIRTTLDRRSMISGVFSLLPGEMLYTDSKMKVHTHLYWDLPLVPLKDKEHPDFNNAVENVKQLVHDAVEEQLISDVPLGGFLSGGLDSCVISSLASKLTHGNYNAYNVGYDEEGFNEWTFVKEASEHYNMNCEIIGLQEENYTDIWKKLITMKGLPLSTPNEVPIYHLAKELKKDFTVALSGEGADEIFGGYTTPYFSAYDFERSLREPMKDTDKLNDSQIAIQRMYGRPHFFCRADHFFSINSWIPFAIKRNILQDKIWLDGLDEDDDIFNYYDDLFEKYEDCSTFDAYMHIHAKINLEGLLFRVDSSSMSASVETRVPFTDHRIAEYLFTLPDTYKMDWQSDTDAKKALKMNIGEIDKGQLLDTKRLLRKAYSSQIPKSIVHRPKMSFPVPFLKWFSGPWKQFSEEILENSPLLKDLFAEQQVQALHRSSQFQQSAIALWPIINLCLWQQEWNIHI